MHIAENKTGGAGEQANPSASQSGLAAEEWVRLPGINERLEGLSRAAVYRIIDDPASGVVSVSMKQPGTDRGIRLIGKNSLRAYIARCAHAQLADRLAVKGAQ